MAEQTSTQKPAAEAKAKDDKVQAPEAKPGQYLVGGVLVDPNGKPIEKAE